MARAMGLFGGSLHGVPDFPGIGVRPFEAPQTPGGVVDDGGERLVEFVGQAGGHFAHGADAEGVGELGLAPAGLFFGLFAFGDIAHEAVVSDERALLISHLDHHAVLVKYCAVLAHAACLKLSFPLGKHPLIGLERARSILGMDRRSPVTPDEFIRDVAHHLGIDFVHLDVSAVGVEAGDTRHGVGQREVLVPQGLLGAFAVGEVLCDSGDSVDVPALISDGERAISDPSDRAIGTNDSVFLGELAQQVFLFFESCPVAPEVLYGVTF